jgi:hypothetical protein
VGGMSRIRLNIDRLVLNGFQPLEAKALSEALQSQLSEALSDRRTRAEWARSHRTPMLKLGRISLDTGTVGARKFAKQVAQAVRKGLKP